MFFRFRLSPCYCPLDAIRTSSPARRPGVIESCTCSRHFAVVTVGSASVFFRAECDHHAADRHVAAKSVTEGEYRCLSHAI
jgi:hypothetical protein